MTNRTVGTLLALSIVLAGCTSDDKKPTVLPPAPSASPFTTAVPSLPPEAMAETAEGAVAFARYFLEVVGTAFATSDSNALKAASAPGCGGCDALVEAIDELQASEKKRIGGDYVIKAALAPAVEGGDVLVDITYERTAARIVDATGQVESTAGPVPATDAQMRLIRSGNSWVVQGYRVLEGR